MRILCLHGYGTSGKILKAQLDPFLREADPSHEFVFMDGEYECVEGKGISQSWPGPFLCYGKAFGPYHVQASLEHLQTFIEDEGPFDGILGFSQGGSIALSYLLTEAISGAMHSLKFAILLSTAVPFSPDTSFCVDALSSLTDTDRKILSNFPHDTAQHDYSDFSDPHDLAMFFKLLGCTLNTWLRGGFIASNTDLGLDSLREHSYDIAKRNLDDLPRPLHPMLLPPGVKVRIPTVHVVGRKDEEVLKEMSGLMVQNCESRLVRKLIHGGGHEPPRAAEDVRALVAALEWAIAQSLTQAW